MIGLVRVGCIVRCKLVAIGDGGVDGACEIFCVYRTIRSRDRAIEGGYGSSSAALFNGILIVFAVGEGAGSTREAVGFPVRWRDGS